jgi:predicted MFS family arabinose efflux permease
MVPRRTWLGILSLALGAAIIVTTEFTPVGFLPDVAATWTSRSAPRG